VRDHRVVTWNVLHRIHAVNWSETPVRAFPDERARMDAIAAEVARWIVSGATAVCLQETSGDQLAALRSRLPPGARIFDHLYPRVPRLRDGSPSPLIDPSEHLVIVVGPAAASTASPRTARTFDHDPGKGLLAVELAPGWVVVDTHVSFGERGAVQLAELSATATATATTPGVTVVLGDFNAPVDVVTRGLGAAFVVADLRGQLPTRLAIPEPPPAGTVSSAAPPPPARPGRTIDHVAVAGGTFLSATVLDGRGLSDHNPVVAEIRG